MNSLKIRIPLKSSTNPSRKTNKKSEEKKLKRKRADDLILLKMNSLLKPGEIEIPQATIQAILLAMKCLIEEMGYHYDLNLILASLIYAEKYVKKTELIVVEDVLEVIMLSLICSLKFWQDQGMFILSLVLYSFFQFLQKKFKTNVRKGVDMELIAQVMSMPLAELREMEIQYMTDLEWDLYLTHENLISFSKGEKQIESAAL